MPALLEQQENSSVWYNTLTYNQRMTADSNKDIQYLKAIGRGCQLSVSAQEKLEVGEAIVP